MTVRFVASVAVVMAVSAAAYAQPVAPTAQPSAQPAPAGPGAPAQPAGALEPPAVPKVDDPKLAPVPPPAHVLRSWQETVSVARNRSTNLRIARAEVERARGASRQALAGALPSLTGQASVTRTIFDTNDSGTSSTAAGGGASRDPWSWRAGLTLTQPLFALRDWYAIGTAKRNEKNAVLSAEDQERLMLGDVADAVVAVIVAERVAELNRTGLRTALETLELTRIRDKLGAATSLDLVRVRQDAAVARSAVVSGDESLRQAREALGSALGYGEPWGVAPGFDLPAFEAGIRGTCSQVPDVEQRTDLIIAKNSVEIAERGVTDVELGFAPTVDLTSTLSAQPAQVGSGAAATWSVSAVLNVPIWDGGARYGALRSARAGVDEAQQKLEATRRGASTEVTRARRGIDVAEEARGVSAEARDLALETERLARLGFAAGRGTSLDLVQASQQRRQAEVQLVLKEFDVFGARITALLATAKCDPASATPRAPPPPGR